MEIGKTKYINIYFKTYFFSAAVKYLAKYWKLIILGRRDPIVSNKTCYYIFFIMNIEYIITSSSIQTQGKCTQNYALMRENQIYLVSC